MAVDLYKYSGIILRMEKPLFKIIYANESYLTSELSGPSIFLAGPTPRSVEVFSWRPVALDLLTQMKFNGTVLVPERKDWSVKFDYGDQIEWELQGLDAATVVVFWIPRNMENMIGLTTNVEFGMLVKQKFIMYGRPHTAAHVRYLDHLYHKFTNGVPYTTMHDLLESVVQIVPVVHAQKDK